MTKKIVSFAVAGLFTLGMGAGMASAATVSYPLFSNGDTTIDATGNSTVTGTFTLQVGANETCEVLRTQVDGYPFTDTSVGGPLGDQQGTYTNVPFSVKVPPNTGTYNATVQCAGIWGGNHSIDGADNVVVGPVSLGTIRVVANTSDSSSGGTSIDGINIADLLALLKSLGLNLGGATGTTPTTPTPGASCAQLGSYVYFGFGDTGMGVKAAQNFIMNNGGSIAAGATGFWGNQSIAALSQAKAANHCN